MIIYSIILVSCYLLDRLLERSRIPPPRYFNQFGVPTFHHWFDVLALFNVCPARLDRSMGPSKRFDSIRVATISRGSRGSRGSGRFRESNESRSVRSRKRALAQFQLHWRPFPREVGLTLRRLQTSDMRDYNCRIVPAPSLSRRR